MVVEETTEVGTEVRPILSLSPPGQIGGSLDSYDHAHKVLKTLFPGKFHPMGKVAGRLQLFVQNWQKLSSDPSILETVTGWKIPFHSKPTQQHPPRMFSHDREQQSLISKEVDSMLEKGAIVKTHPIRDQVLSNIFL